MTLKSDLDRFLEIRATLNASVENDLRPGLSLGKLQEMTRNLPYPLPEEVVQLYQWHDGLYEVDGAFLHFLPLTEAIRFYEDALTFNEPNLEIWSDTWFPILNGGGYQFCAVLSQNAKLSAIQYVDVECAINRKVFASVSELVEFLLDCALAGMFKWNSEHGFIEYDKKAFKLNYRQHQRKYT